MIFRLVFLLSFSVVFFLQTRAQTEDSPGLSADGKEQSYWEPFYRGELKKTTGKYDDAIAEYDKAIAIYPDFHEAYLERAASKFLKYDFQSALADYDLAIQVLEKKLQDFSNKSEIKKILGNNTSANEDIIQAEKLKPVLTDAYYKRGSVRRFE
jgi:tetratricopeptide (TPR) repeat protein